METIFYLTGLIFWTACAVFLCTISIVWLIYVTKKSTPFKFIFKWYEWHFKRRKVMNVYLSLRDSKRAAMRSSVSRMDHPTAKKWLGLYETTEINPQYATFDRENLAISAAEKFAQDLLPS